MSAPASRLTQNTLSSQASDTVHRLKGAVRQIDTKSPGTGFLVTPNCLLTCCHVLPEKEVAQNAYACFSDIQSTASVALNPDPSKNGFYHASKLQHEDGKIGFTAKHLDFAIVALSQTMEKISDIFVLTDQFPPQKERIHVIQHPVIEVMKRDPDTNRPLEIKQLTGEKRIATGQVTEFDQYTIHHTAPVAGGASGAPIVNDAGHLYAFHQAECTNPAHKKCSNPEHAKSKNPVHKDCEIQVNCGIGVRTDAVFRYLKSEQISLDVFDEQRKCTALKAKYAKQSHLELVRPVRGHKDWILKFPIEAIYTELAILPACPKENKEPNALTQPSKTANTHERLTSKPISHDKFFSMLRDKKKVLLLGVAGTGKTTFCHYLAFHWANGSILPEYPHLFWIRLRHLKEHESLKMLFEKEFGINVLTDKHLSSALLVIDGYDELPSYAEALFQELIARFHYVLVTSRPKPYIPFNSAAQLEIMGLASNRVSRYIECYFTALQTQYPDELSLNEALSKARRLQELLATYPLLSSLANISVNLSLLCAIFSQEENFLTNQQITTTILYNYVVNWMYTCFQIRQKELALPVSILTADLASQKNPLLDPVIQNLEHNLCNIALHYTQNNILYSNQQELENWLVRQKARINTNQLNESGLFRVEDEVAEFIHLSYQDFFVARHLANLYQLNQSAARAFVKKYKLQENYQEIFCMTAGLLSLDDIDLLSLYFNDLHVQAPDLGKSYELKLLARCYAECRSPNHLSKYSIFLKNLLKFLRKNPNRNLKSELFKHNHELLFHPQVIDFVCVLQARELEWFIEQIIRFKQKIPSRILEQICNNFFKDWNIFEIPEALSILGKVAQNDQQLTEHCMQFICSFLQTRQGKSVHWLSPGRHRTFTLYDHLGVSAPSVDDREGRSIIHEDYRENSTNAYRILITVLKQKKKDLPPGEDLFDWIEGLNIHQEFKFCMILEYLNEGKPQLKIQDSRYLSYLNRFLNLESPSPQETFDGLIRLISESSSFILNRYLLQLISILAHRERETINIAQAVTDLIKLSKDGNRWTAEALINLATMGFLLSEHINGLISYFDLLCSEKNHLYIPEAKYFITQILVECVKNKNILSFDILYLFEKNHCGNVLIQIAKAKRGHALDAFDCIKKDLNLYLKTDFHSILDLSNDSYFKSNLDAPIYTHYLNKIDHPIESIEDSKKNHSQFESTQEKTNQKLISENSNLYEKSKSVEINNNYNNNNNLKEIKKIISSKPFLKYKTSSKFITLTKIKINTDDISNHTLVFLFKQPCIKISKNLIKRFIHSLDLEILLLLRYSDYKKKSWGRKLFIQIAYLTGQPFIEAEQG